MAHSGIRPILWLALAALAITFALMCATAPNAGAAQCKGGDSSLGKINERTAEKAVVCLINKERHGAGKRPLKRHDEQTRAARDHSDIMIRKRCFSHQCPGEKDLTGRLTKADYLPCGCSWGIAENIAYGSGSRGSPRSIVDAWMNSPGHRVNILNGSYQHIGVGVSRGSPFAARDRDSGTYTAVFGYRR